MKTEEIIKELHKKTNNELLMFISCFLISVNPEISNKNTMDLLKSLK